MEILAVIGVYAALIYVLIRCKGKPERKITPELMETIDKITYLKQQYVKIQQLLFDIDTSRPDAIKGFDVEWLTVSGDKKDVNIWTGGNTETSHQMRQLARARLNEVTTALNNELDKIPERNRPNVDRTTHNSQKGEC